MMHSQTFENITILHNGDYSGDVEIINDHGDSTTRIEMPFEHLKEFMAEYVRQGRISKLEQMDADEILTGEPPP